MASISPICKKCKNFISALKSPTYIDFIVKKLTKIQDIEISHLGNFNIFLRESFLRFFLIMPLWNYAAVILASYKWFVEELFCFFIMEAS